MARNYTELEAWGIFIGGFVIAIVLTSIFWAYITLPESNEEKQEYNASKEAENDNQNARLSKPDDFINFCRKVNGRSEWDSSGMKKCIIIDSSEKNLEKNMVIMNLLCKKFNLTMTYGSYGVKCEGKV